MNISFWTQKWSSLSKMISQNNSFEIPVDVWQKSAQYCQANILQSKNLKNWMAHLTIYCGSVAKSCLTVCDPRLPKWRQTKQKSKYAGTTHRCPSRAFKISSPATDIIQKEPARQTWTPESLFDTWSNTLLDFKHPLFKCLQYKISSLWN